MRPRVLLFLILGVFLLTPACGEEKSSEPLFNHPDEISIEFSESVSERDKQLITMAIDITRPIVEDIGVPFGAEIHVSGDRDSYIRLDQEFRLTSAKEAAENYTFTRGVALTYSGQVLINISLHDVLYIGNRRDSTLVFTVIHELYHLLQVRISEGWSDSTNEPSWIKENSANMFAWRTILESFCRPLSEINLAVASFSETPECPKEFVEENIFERIALTFLRNPTISSAVELYIIATFGADAFDDYYAAFLDTAATLTGSTNEEQEELWIRTLEKTFNESSLDDLIESAGKYIEEHEVELSKYLVTEQN